MTLAEIGGSLAAHMATKHVAKPPTPPKPGEVDPTPIWAMLFAKLLHVGCPPVEAVAHILPELADDREQCVVVAVRWKRDALVIGELNQLNGGAFIDLPRDTRLKLVWEKLTAEAAYYLWDANFCNIRDKDELGKIKMAREMVGAEIGKQPDEADPMMAFARLAQELAKSAVAEKHVKATTPPQTGVGLFAGSTKHRQVKDS